MTRTAIYSLQDNTLTEQSEYDLPPDRPNIRNYSSSQQEMYQRHLEAWQIVMQGYNANKEQYEKTLRTIPAHESARSLWKDGQEVQDGKDYEVRVKREYMIDKSRWLTPVEDMGNPFDDGEFMAFPLPVKNEDEPWEDVCQIVIENSDAVDYDCGPAIMKLQQKYIITKR